MKKKIMIGAFSALIILTAIISVFGAIAAYNYEVANDDIMPGVGAGMILVIGCFVVFYESDLFYTTYYFFTKSKTIAKSVLNVVSNLTLLSIVFTDSIARFLYRYVSKIFGEEVIVLFALLFMYVILRIACAAISVNQFDKEN